MEEDLRYRIQGEVNGEELYGLGKGALDPKQGTMDLEVEFDSVPRGWDPRTVTLICCNRGMALASYEKDDATNLLSLSNGVITMGEQGPKRGGSIYASDGEPLAKIRASADTDLLDENYDRSEVSPDSVSQLEPGVNGIDNIVTPFEGMMIQPGQNLVSLLTEYGVALEDGREGYGSTHYPHYLPNPSGETIEPQRFTVEEADSHYQNGRLETYTKTSVEPLEKASKSYENVLSQR